MIDLVSLAIFLFMIVSTIWVYFDAKSIGVKKGQIRGLGNIGPVGWLCACFGLWIVAFPLYLIKRPQFKAINRGAA